jgi:RNA polymerase sigma-70 factor (ECF subfamily)
MTTPRPAPLRLAGDRAEVEERGVAAAQPGPALVHDGPTFERLVMAHLDAAHNLAWWLTQDSEAAADVVQDACLKAWRAFPTLRSQDGRAWLLTIVRTTAYSRLRRRPEPEPLPEDAAAPRVEPLAGRLAQIDSAEIEAALAAIPSAHREVLVLRDLEGLTYAQIALVIGVPAGTVMSRISRARDALRRRLEGSLGKE